MASVVRSGFRSACASTPACQGGSVRPKVARSLRVSRRELLRPRAPASGTRWSAPARSHRRATLIGRAGCARELDHVARIAVPAGLAGGDQRGRCRPSSGRASAARSACAVTSASSSAPVGAPIWSSITRQRVALARQPQHGLGEVAAARRVDPAGAQDQVRGSRSRGSRSRLRAWCGRRRSAGRSARLRARARVPLPSNT